MPVHIGNLTSEVTVLDGDMPLSAGQIEKLVRLVLDRLEQQQRAQRQTQQATAIRNEAVSASRLGE